MYNNREMNAHQGLQEGYRSFSVLPEFKKCRSLKNLEFDTGKCITIHFNSRFETMKTACFLNILLNRSM